jgi:glycosyltransferase involved in cell wall biosynthesis
LKIFVNAVSIKEGGPRVVLVKLLTAMRRERPDIQICVAAPQQIFPELWDAAVTPLPFSVGQSPIAIAKWYEIDLARAARRWATDAVFSVTNYLPHRRLSIPTLLLEQHAGHFSSTFDRLMRAAAPSFLARLAWGQTRRWVHRSVETATVLTVQTSALADAIAAATRVARDRIRVIPHGPGWVNQRDTVAIRRGERKLRIGYVSKSGVHKNFTTLFRAVEHLSQQGRNVRLVLTLDRADPEAVATLLEADAIGIGHLIENYGEVSPNEIANVYDGLDVFAFPSLCESFGMPMVEAMARGLCMVVADTPENREVVGTAGVVFPALDAENLAKILGRLKDDEQTRQAYANLSLRRASDFCWRKAAKETLVALDAAIARGYDYA